MEAAQKKRAVLVVDVPAEIKANPPVTTFRSLLDRMDSRGSFRAEPDPKSLASSLSPKLRKSLSVKWEGAVKASSSRRVVSFEETEKAQAPSKEALQALSGAEQDRALEKARSKKTLEKQLESLERHSNEVLMRWNGPDDFAKVDVVCTELLRRGSYGDALRYMEKVRFLVDNVCRLLRTKAGHQISQSWDEPAPAMRRAMAVFQQMPPQAKEKIGFWAAVEEAALSAGVTIPPLSPSPTPKKAPPSQEAAPQAPEPKPKENVAGDCPMCGINEMKYKAMELQEGEVQTLKKTVETLQEQNASRIEALNKEEKKREAALGKMQLAKTDYSALEEKFTRLEAQNALLNEQLRGLHQMLKQEREESKRRLTQMLAYKSQLASARRPSASSGEIGTEPDKSASWQGKPPVAETESAAPVSVVQELTKSIIEAYSVLQEAPWMEDKTPDSMPRSKRAGSGKRPASAAGEGSLHVRGGIATGGSRSPSDGTRVSTAAWPEGPCRPASACQSLQPSSSVVKVERTRPRTADATLGGRSSSLNRLKSAGLPRTRLGEGSPFDMQQARLGRCSSDGRIALPNKATSAAVSLRGPGSNQREGYSNAGVDQQDSSSGTFGARLLELRKSNSQHF